LKLRKAIEFDTEDPEINQWINYYSMADLFGWTPTEVDEQDFITTQAMILVAQQVEKINRRKEKQMKRRL